MSVSGSPDYDPAELLWRLVDASPFLAFLVVLAAS